MNKISPIPQIPHNPQIPHIPKIPPKQAWTSLYPLQAYEDPDEKKTSKPIPNKK
jgi:hypothetical protein